MKTVEAWWVRNRPSRPCRLNLAGLVANALVANTAVPGTVWVLLPSLLVWFVLGFALFSFLSAATGAMVARQEEVQMMSLPLTVPLVAGFLLTYTATLTADSWWFRCLSFLPPLAPVLMPARLAAGHLAPWEVPLAVVIMLAAIAGVVRVTARIYALSLVRSGALLSWGEALRLREG
jgi:ABC-2 type transport system permease protein